MWKWIGVAVLVIPLAVLGVWAFKWYTADIRGAIGAREQIKASGQYRIDRYDHFFDLCAAVQAHEATLTAQRELLSATTDERERRRVLANIAGVTAQRARLIAQYNADSSKSYTSAQFKASSLPYALNQAQESTTCAIP